MSKFQVILLCVFGFFIFLAVLVFALYKGSSDSQASVTIWGSFTSSDFNLLLNNSNLTQDDSLTIYYVEKPAESLAAEYTEALAQGIGPDLLIISQDQFWQNKNKLIAIPYESVSERNFKDAFAEGAELFLAPEGVYALPLSVDPLVLYYNRDLLSAGGFAKPMGYWDEIFAQSGKLTRRDAAGNITQSTMALGETRNIPRAKDILSLLFLQAGTPVTAFLSTELRSVLSSNFGLPVVPAESALDFYTQFSNPSKPYYSWNRNLPEAQTNFASGDAAYYLGFASELATVRSKSPTLNFGVSLVPQSRVSGKTLTFGRLYGVAVSRGTRNAAASLSAALKLVSKENASAFSRIISLPPARRDLLSEKPTDSIGPVFYDAALQARAWIDPNPQETREIFGGMIDDVTSGRARTAEAVREASQELENIIKK